MEDEILENVVEEIETTPEEPIKVQPEIIPNNPSNPLVDGFTMAAYSAGIMLATTVMVNAGGHLLNAAGRAVGRGAKWVGGKISNGLEARKERKLLKKAQKESSEEETESDED